MLIDLGLGLLEYRIRILGCVIWYDRVVDLAIDKFHNAIDEIPKLCKQFIVVLRNEIPPFELAVGSLFKDINPGLAVLTRIELQHSCCSKNESRPQALSWRPNWALM